MSDVVISSFDPPVPWNWDGTTGTVRFFCDGNFLDSDNRWCLGGDGENGFYYSFPFTVDGSGLIHVASCTIASPLGGRQPNTLYSARLYDEQGTGREFLFTGWTIPQTTPTTLGALEILNEARTLANPLLNYLITSAQVQALINAAVGILNKASAVIYGLVRLSAPPNSAAAPIAMGENDLRVARATGTDSLAANMPTTILSTLVAANSPIEILPAGNGITGRLYPTNRIVGASFDVVSENGSDAGVFRWLLYS